MAVRTSRFEAQTPALGLLDRMGPGDLAIPLFIFTTLAFGDGHVLNDISRLVLVAVFLLDFLSGQRPRINPFLVAAALFLAVSAASLTWTVTPESSSARVMSFIYQFASYFALMNLISWRPRRLELSLTWVIFGSLATGVQVILVQGVTFQDERSVAGVISAGQLAVTCAAGIAISIYRFSKTRRWWHLAAIPILGTFLTMTSGRRGFLLVLIFLVLFMFLSAKRIGGKVRALLVSVAVLFGSYALIMYNSFFYSYVGYRLESFIGYLSGNAFGDASVQGRDRLIDFGLSLFQQSSLFGHGIDSFRPLFQSTHGAWATSADNNYVEMLVDLGVLGFLAYYIPLAIFLIRGLRGITKKGPEVRFAVAFVSSMALLEFSTVSIFSKVGMLMVVLCYMVVHMRRTTDSDFGEGGDALAASRRIT